MKKLFVTNDLSMAVCITSERHLEILARGISKTKNARREFTVLTASMIVLFANQIRLRGACSGIEFQANFPLLLEVLKCFLGNAEVWVECQLVKAQRGTEEPLVWCSDWAGGKYAALPFTLTKEPRDPDVKFFTHRKDAYDYAFGEPGKIPEAVTAKMD